ncbi:MAG: hypothetical protein A2Y20_04795 [Firmicutes bacterium GWF2_51_9]|nr:hypothetical protein [Erysipelotrichaceae bacterium]OGS55101.1 MAG: hypothetical protein A2Y20_04795 [Firmicutes bacterium GWF2_51_9]OGS57428.1 MAG: hypothetical protein A2Y19_02900 [Firmicutes bacterium GWE2_51_13]HAM63170.1 hypothetical protein [Erysipelotrichaceae bacterium]HBZ41549.1 hypothetical protein [Erysipelotrichaceae bacterium]
MSYQEKRTLFSILTGILILVAYGIYAYGKYQSGAMIAEDLTFWAKTILIFIGIGIAVNIVGQIVFHILIAIQIAIKEKLHDVNTDDKAIEKSIQNEMVTDEMDKMIELKSMQTGFFVSGMGFITGLIVLVLNYSPVVMLHIVFVSFSVGSLLEGFLQLYYYRKGV